VPMRAFGKQALLRRRPHTGGLPGRRRRPRPAPSPGKLSRPTMFARVKAAG